MLSFGATASYGLGRWSRREADVVLELRRESKGK